jgi:hypothetical protein
MPMFKVDASQVKFGQGNTNIFGKSPAVTSENQPKGSCGVFFAAPTNTGFGQQKVE